MTFTPVRTRSSKGREGSVLNAASMCYLAISYGFPADG